MSDIYDLHCALISLISRYITFSTSMVDLDYILHSPYVYLIFIRISFTHVMLDLYIDYIVNIDVRQHLVLHCNYGWLIRAKIYIITSTKLFFTSSMYMIYISNPNLTILYGVWIYDIHTPYLFSIYRIGKYQLIHPSEALYHC